MLKHFYLILIFSTVTITAFAQGGMGTYQLNQSLPQSNNLNPAFMPEHKVIIGLPIISSVRVFVDNDGLAFNDYFTYDDNDDLVIDTLDLPNKVGDKQTFITRSEIGLFYFGLRGKRSYFSFALNEIIDFRMSYPGDLIRWGIRGPADPRIAGRDLAISEFGTKTMGYHEFAFGYSRTVKPGLNIGVKLKYLQGVASAETEDINGFIHVGTDSVTISSGLIRVNTAGFALEDQNDPDYTDYLINNKNKGFAIDLGGTYDINERITFSAAIKDLGFIRWSDFTRSYEIDPVNYTYRGFDLLDLINKSATDEFLQQELDSLESLYNSREVDGIKYTTRLNPKTYLGANYKLGKKHNVGALVYFDFFQGKMNPSIALSYNIKLGRILNAVVNTGMVNGTFTGFGFGFTLKLTGMQIYASTDQMMSAIYPARASVVEAHAGMNLVFGRVKKPKVEEPEEEEEEPEEEITEEEFLESLEEEDTTTVTEDTTAIMEEAAPVIAPIEEEVVEEIEEVEEQPIDTVEIESEPVIEPEPVQEPIEEELTETYDRANNATVIDRGDHPDELPPGHYVIVGVFKVKDNIEKYSAQLKAAGFDNDYGYISKREAYYIYVKKSDSISEVSKTRDEFRKLKQFQFPDAWVLSMVDK